MTSRQGHGWTLKVAGGILMRNKHSRHFLWWSTDMRRAAKNDHWRVVPYEVGQDGTLLSSFSFYAANKCPFHGLQCKDTLCFFMFLMFIFETHTHTHTHTQSKQGRGRERRRHRIRSRLQALSCQHRVQSPTRGSNSRTVRWWPEPNLDA